jgi:hypothetical protein
MLLYIILMHLVCLVFCISFRLYSSRASLKVLYNSGNKDIKYFSHLC